MTDKIERFYFLDSHGDEAFIREAEHGRVVSDLQSQLEQLRAENEALRKELANSEKYQGQLLSSDLVSRSRAIQLCKDKAAECGRELYGDIGIVTAATYNAQKKTADELAAKLEKL